MSLFFCLSGISLGHIVGTPAPPPSFIKGGGWVFKIFEKKGGSNFFHKKGGVGEIGGDDYFKKRGYDLFSY